MVRNGRRISLRHARGTSKNDVSYTDVLSQFYNIVLQCLYLLRLFTAPVKMIHIYFVAYLVLYSITPLLYFFSLTAHSTPILTLPPNPPPEFLLFNPILISLSNPSPLFSSSYVGSNIIFQTIKISTEKVCREIFIS